MGMVPAKVTSMIHDLRSVLRSLARAPGFSILVIATLALGIGGAAGIFSLVNTLLIRPLPFREEAQLVRMRDAVSRPGDGDWRYNTSARSFVEMREWGRVFDGIVAQRYRPMILTNPGDPERVTAIGVSADWTEVLGVGPILGRPFTPDEERLGRDARVVLIGHELWQNRFGGDPGVLSRPVTLDGRVYTVVGVMPPTYNYPYGADLWVPDTFEREDVAFGPYVVGRLAAGWTLESAQAQLDELSGVLAEEYPESHASIRLLAVPIRDDLVSNSPRLGLALLLGAGVLLVLACFNIANLLLVRGTGRRAELAVRAAMGAARGRQLREQLMESLVLGLTGGAAGLVLASALARLMTSLSMEADSSLGAFFTQLGLDWRVATFALATGLATAALFGVIPALRASRVDPRSVLAEAGRTSQPAGGRWLDGLVGAELAVAFVLLAGAGLMVENIAALRSDDPGYRVEDLMTFRVGMSGAAFAGESVRVPYLNRMLDRLNEEPAVRSVGAVQHLPFDDGSASTAYSIEGGPGTEGERRLLTNNRIVAGDYLAAMGIPIQQGRPFTASELREDRGVIIVNRAFADRYWPDGPIGRRLKTGAIDSDSPWLTVVGVVANADENFDLRETIYVPYSQVPVGEMSVVAEVAPPAPAGALRRAVRAVDPEQPLAELSTVADRVRESLESQAAATRLMVGFAAFGLLLAGLGIYGVLAYSVRSRGHELAVRQALGLSPRGAVAMVLKKSLVLAVVGIAIGIPVAMGFMRLLVEVLGGTTRNVAIDARLLAEHATLGAGSWVTLVAAVLLAALAASTPPATRAAATHPARTLRNQ